ncbi:unnamed protein product [Prorocentrum cordatum]|uniref:J domain-containing protein n=1 Tax=Prorocentrum cordatum TaxID=2364126 RepID=A0ABN9V643_9DINO|nr:unnamed protein product [Polarella glacialis]
MAARASYSPYAELGVAPGAPAREVRRAFLRIARRFHPDKCHEPGAGERFRRAQEAFAALGRAGAGAPGQAPEPAPRGAPECASDSESWEAPRRPAEKKAEPAEVVDPDEPVLCLAGLLQLLRQHCGGGAPSAGSLRRRFLQAAVPWPWDLGGPALHAALARALRDELDARVAAMESWRGCPSGTSAGGSRRAAPR